MKKSTVNKQDALGTTKLFEAVSDGEIREIVVLLRQGADPNVADNNGTTPLMEAASSGNLTVAKLLLDHGAKPDTADLFGDTAVDYARNQKFPDLAVFLTNKIEQSRKSNGRK